MDGDGSMCCNEVWNVTCLYIHMHHGELFQENQDTPRLHRLQNLVKKLISSLVWFIDDFATTNTTNFYEPNTLNVRSVNMRGEA